MQSAIVSGVISFLFGSGLVGYLKFVREGKNERRTFLEGEVEKYRKEVEVLTNAVSALSARLIPTNFPLWIKDANQRYIDVNPSWEINIGGRLDLFKAQVIGKTDTEIFTDYPDFAEMMVRLDQEAKESNGVAIQRGVFFPKSKDKKQVVKEVLVHDILGQVIYKGMAIPDI